MAHYALPGWHSAARRLSMPREATSRPVVDTLTIRAIGVEADADVRTVQRELAQPGSVRGRPGERVRAVLKRRGLLPTEVSQ